MGRVIFLMSLAVTAVLATSEAAAQVRVQYGRVTNVQTTTVNNSTSQNVGTVVGGGIGLVSGSGQSGSNRALRGITGAAAGRGVGTLAGRSQAFEYTVLVDGMTTVRVVSDQAGKRVGDCVAVEQGQFANIRLVPESRCAPRSQPHRPRRHPPRPRRRRRPWRPTCSRLRRASRRRRSCWLPTPTRSSTGPSGACGFDGSGRARPDGLA